MGKTGLPASRWKNDFNSGRKKKDLFRGPAERKWGYTTLSVVDWNGDGLKDIVCNSIWGKIEWFENIGEKGKPKLAASKPIKVEWKGNNPKTVVELVESEREKILLHNGELHRLVTTGTTMD